MPKIISKFHFLFQSYQGSIFTLSANLIAMLNPVFQSYQGSIFTHQFLPIGTAKITFQSYQGSIFTRILRGPYVRQVSFNPIKVLFLPEEDQRTSEVPAFNPIKVLFLQIFQYCE